jgi:hypothetical protein
MIEELGFFSDESEDGAISLTACGLLPLIFEPDLTFGSSTVAKFGWFNKKK